MIRGVNLGNWLVLEKWMSPEFFDGTTAEDETYFCLQLSENEKRARLKVHRDSYITDRDFAFLASKGINTVRLPIPFFVLEDIGPYVSCAEYVDKALSWGEAYGIKVLLDLHTVPGSQNGSDNSGLCGIVQWANHPERVALTLDVLERVALRWGQHPALFGIQVLNEPITTENTMFKMMGDRDNNNGFSSEDRYPAVDKEAAKNNKGYDNAFLAKFYTDAYARIRKYLPVSKPVVYHDAFDHRYWAEWLAAQPFENVMLDTHQYMMMGAMLDMEHKLTDDELLEKIETMFTEACEYSSARVPTFVGEWCISSMRPSMEGLSLEEKKPIYQKLSRMHFRAFASCDGWFYWSYKLHATGPVEAWDAGRCLSLDWLPEA